MIPQEYIDRKHIELDYKGRLGSEIHMEVFDELSSSGFRPTFIAHSFDLRDVSSKAFYGFTNSCGTKCPSSEMLEKILSEAGFRGRASLRESALVLWEKYFSGKFSSGEVPTQNG